MTIEKLKDELESLRPNIEADTENMTGDEATYAEGQLAMLDQILEMLD